LVREIRKSQWFAYGTLTAFYYINTNLRFLNQFALAVYHIKYSELKFSEPA